LNKTPEETVKTKENVKALLIDMRKMIDGSIKMHNQTKAIIMKAHSKRSHMLL
jgi:hypothetical protein